MINICSADKTLSSIITMQCEGQLVIDMRRGAGTVSGLMRVRDTAGAECKTQGGYCAY